MAVMTYAAAAAAAHAESMRREPPEVAHSTDLRPSRLI
jgi:hypothetical protein